MITYQTDGSQSLSSFIPVSIFPDDGLAILRMEACDATVILEDTGREYVVKVRMSGQRQIRKASTSGYPVAGAFQTWRKLQGKDGGK